MFSYDAFREREDALAQDAMTDGEYMSCALSHYAHVHGAEDKEAAWILSPYDTWHANPYYRGPPQPHPEEDLHDTDVPADEIEVSAPMFFDDDLPF